MVLKPADFYDFHSVILHELGHAHLLKHINQPEDLMFWELLPNDDEIANFNRKISLSPSNINGGTDIMNHSTGIDFSFCNENDDVITELQLTNCNFAMNVSDQGINSNQLSIYPNPTTGVFSIHYTHVQGAPTYLIIYNAVGEKIGHTINLPSQSESGISQLNLSHLAPGLYFAEIRSKSFQKTKRFIIQ